MRFAINDFILSLGRWRLWMLLGWLEIRQRYARSQLGPFWLTISTSVLIFSIGIVYGTLFGQDLRNYLPFLAVSIVFWTMFSQTVNEGALAYISSANFIKQISTPRFVFIFQVVWRNTIILAHNFILIIVILCIFGLTDYRPLFLLIPGFILFVVNASWIAVVVALVSARFRDLPQIIAAFLQMAFYVTPIMYKPATLKKYEWVVNYNPLTYIIALVRDPLTGVFPDAATWAVCITIAFFGWVLAFFVTGRYSNRITYWV